MTVARRPLGLAAAVALLGGPVVIAFASGGYFPQPQLWAALVAWGIVAVAAVIAPVPVPRRRAAAAAAGGILGLTAWTAVSVRWAPLRDVALHDAVRLALYAGALLAAIAVLRGVGALRAAEAAVAAGATVIVAYGLSGRLLPGLVELHHSASAGGRLEQPLTYWNAMGITAALGLVLCARIASDPARRDGAAALAAAATVALSLGVLLSFSRGALAALAVGVLVVLALDPRRNAVRIVLLLAVLGAVAGLVGDRLASVRVLSGSLVTREIEGAAMALVLVALMAIAVLGVARVRRDQDRRLAAAPPRWLAAVVVLALCAGTIALSGAIERSSTGAGPRFGATAARLGSIQSNRYAYWHVALDEFTLHPLAGLGSGGFRVAWLRHRTVLDPALNAHSLYIETAAELGLVGLLALAALLAGAAAGARDAVGRHPAAVGPAAALVAYALHAGVDWDWQLPAVTLPALLLAGALLANAGPGPPAEAPAR